MFLNINLEFALLGLQYPYAACYVVDVRKNDSECDAATKPDISKMEPRACNIEACDSYEWKTKDGTCSVSCGDGKILFRHRIIVIDNKFL